MSIPGIPAFGFQCEALLLPDRVGELQTMEPDRETHG